MKSYVRTGYVTSSGPSRNTLSKLNDGGAFVKSAVGSDQPQSSDDDG